MKKLPIGIQNIREILEQDQVYVDKTGFIKELVDKGKYYFMSRPRRFGKSLFLNTLEEVFKGNKELFKGLAIYESDYDWKKYPIVHLDFSKIANSTPEELKTALKRRLSIISDAHNVSIFTDDVQIALDTLVIELSKKYTSKVVVLIDEYDKPIIDRLNELDIAQKNRDILKGFFGTLKGLDDHLRFTFITGISKFSQVSLFSALNNLKDITMDSRYAGMMGYTEEELKVTFQPHIQMIAHERSERGATATEEAIIDEIRSWYNGYRFSKGDIRVYNPFSTLNFMDTKDFAGYWYSTGTPSFLIDQLKKQPLSISTLPNTFISMGSLSNISSLEYIDMPALMFQTGYLTIQGYDPKYQAYQLDFPNREVKEAFYDSLIQDLTRMNPMDVTRSASQVREDLNQYELASFINRINTHFAKMSYQMFAKSSEGFFQAVFFTLLEKSGIHTTAEVETNIGRIDLVSETPKTIYIFELKLDKTAEMAIEQTYAKRYKERYLEAGKEIVILGINFSSTSRNISDWKGALFSSSGKFIREFLP